MFLVIKKRGFTVFRGPVFVSLIVLFVCLCFLGFAYFSLVLAVLGFRHIHKLMEMRQGRDRQGEDRQRPDVQADRQSVSQADWAVYEAL